MIASLPTREDAMSAAVRIITYPGEFIALRHSGRSNGKWREVSLAGHSPHEAFGRAAKELRQGAVALVFVAPDSIGVARFTSAPRLRSRW